MYGHLPPIPKTIQIRRTWYAGHCWRSKDELISDVLQRTPSPRPEGVGRPARTDRQKHCEDTGCSPKDLPGVMGDWEGWRESSTTSRWICCIYIYIYICVCVCVCVCRFLRVLFCTFSYRKRMIYTLICWIHWSNPNRFYPLTHSGHGSNCNSRGTSHYSDLQN